MPVARARRPRRPHARSGASSSGRPSCSAQQRAWLDDFWARSDVEVGGQPALQQAIRWNLFELAQATRTHRRRRHRRQGRHRVGIRRPLLLGLRDLRHAVPDLHGADRRPQCAPIPPEDAARRARSRDRDEPGGALFPWRTINGLESSAYYAAGTAQYHIDADIAHALCSTWPPPATTTSSPAGPSTSSSRPPACGRTSASGAATATTSSTSTASPAPTSTRPS